jgi:hypothetical protein
MRLLRREDDNAFSPVAAKGLLTDSHGAPGMPLPRSTHNTFISIVYFCAANQLFLSE